MSSPFMQLYVADYLGDTQHLTCEQHGAYLLLLMAMWRAGGTLPNDDAKLARIVRLSPAKWRRIRDDVVALLDVEGGEITQKRLAAEYRKAQEKSEKRADAGRQGARAKALKNNDPVPANASRLPKHSSEPEPERGSCSLRSHDLRAVEDEFVSQFWPAYPHKVGKPAALRAYRSARKRAGLQEILTGLAAYVANKPPRHPWCNPATYLNQDRWTDEPVYARDDRPASNQSRASGGDRMLAALAESCAGEPGREAMGQAEDPGGGGADRGPEASHSGTVVELRPGEHGWSMGPEREGDSGPHGHVSGHRWR